MSDAVTVTLDCDSDQQVSPPNHSSSSRINTTSDIHNIEDDIELLRGLYIVHDHIQLFDHLLQTKSFWSGENILLALRFCHTY